MILPRRLKAVVGRHLLAGAADELERALWRLSIGPHHPSHETLAVGVDQRIELIGVGLLERTQLVTG